MMNYQVKDVVLIALLISPLMSLAADINISLINDIYDDMAEAEAKLDLLREEVSEIISYPGAPEVVLDGIINVAGKGEGSFTDLFAEYLANRENAENVASILENEGFFTAQEAQQFVVDRLDDALEAGRLAAAGARLRDIAVGLGSRASTGIDAANFVWGEVAEATENRFGDTATRLAAYKQSLEKGECVVAIVVGHGVTMANKITIELQNSVRFENQFQLIGVGTVGSHVIGGNFVYDRNDAIGESPSNDNDSRITESTNTTILPDGTIGRAPPYLPADLLFHYFNGNQSGVRLRGLITDAVENARRACGFRITESIYPTEVFNTIPGGTTTFDVATYWAGLPQFPVTLYTSLGSNCFSANCAAGVPQTYENGELPIVWQGGCYGYVDFFDSLFGDGLPTPNVPITLTSYAFLIDAEGVVTNNSLIQLECTYTP